MRKIIFSLTAILFLMISTSLVYAEISDATYLDNDPNRLTSEYLALVKFFDIRILNSDIFFTNSVDLLPNYLQHKNFDLLLVLEPHEKLIMFIENIDSPAIEHWEVWELRENATKQYLPIFGDRILVDANSIDWRNCDRFTHSDCHQYVGYTP